MNFDSFDEAMAKISLKPGKDLFNKRKIEENANDKYK